MKKILTVAAMTGAALTLAACGGEAPEAPPAEEPAAEATEAAPAEEEAMTDEEAAALEAAAGAAEGTDPNGNPVGPMAPGNPVGPDTGTGQ